MSTVQRIRPFLWFASGAEEAARFYVSVFPNSSIRSVSRGSTTVVDFRVDGTDVSAMDGHVGAPFSAAHSFLVTCEGQAEVDRLWEALTTGADPAYQRCGWLRDRFGVTWQIVPSDLPQLLSHPDAATRARVIEAMMPMSKIDIAQLLDAARDPRER